MISVCNRLLKAISNIWTKRNVQAKGKSLAGKKVVKAANKSNLPALVSSPLKSKGSSIRKSNSKARQSVVKQGSGLKAVRTPFS